MSNCEFCKHNIFTLPCKSSIAVKKGFSLLAYAPLTGKVFLCSQSALKRIEQKIITSEQQKLLKRFYPDGICNNIPSLPIHPDNYSRLTIIPSHACNFSCSYCYAAQGRSPLRISRSHLKSGLEYFLRPNRTNKHLKIMITGGGEPLTAWEEIKYLLQYANELALRNQYNIYCTLMTNGGLLDENKILFLKQHNVHICVSFDITEFAQNHSRQNYKQVCESITLSTAMGASVSCSATVTPDTIEEIPQMISVMQTKFPLIKNVSIEPVTPNDGFVSAEKAKAFYDRFQYLFLQYCEPCEVPLISCTILDFMQRQTSRCCPGKLCLTPQGTFSICHCVSSPQETRYADSIYGFISDDGKCIFDIQKYTTLMLQGTNTEPQCQNCFAKYNCAGMCLTRQDCYSPEIQKVYCDFVRNFMQQKLENYCLENFGLCLN